MNIKIKKIFLIINSIILILGLIKGFHKPFISLYLFTRQTVLLINIYFLFLFFNINNKIQKYLSFIILIDCLLLLSYNFKIENPQLYYQRNFFAILVANLEHIFLPLIFIYYYFFLDKTALKLKHFYISLIHCFLYGMVILIFNKSPYKFLEPNEINLKIIFLITIFLSLFSLLLLFLKNKKIDKINKFLNKN
ncbi:MAG: hypothetical protein Q8875_02240 [Pigeon pea little leaf phytoplasma]|uniref:Integral membrane protein n=1 Tax=Candidatus Phytoplasma fabacearum TaxID=2982628 RepID=A0ABU8ZTS3_9MOLU|nr:hypothetical protein [Pigeon pea little leaf phytoplasma]